MKTFEKVICSICKSEIGMNGVAYTSHMRMHVHKDEAIELKTKKGLKFMSKEEYFNLIQNYPYAILGEEPLPEQPKEVWEVPDISKAMPCVNPASYFITSGEAVKKADQLVKDAYSLATKALAFRNLLKKTRGKKIYLETCREDNRLLVKRKCPRSKIDKECHE